MYPPLCRGEARAGAHSKLVYIFTVKPSLPNTDSRLVPTKPNGPPKGSWEPDDHGAEGGTARGPRRPTSGTKAEDEGSDRTPNSLLDPREPEWEGVVESRAGLRGALCGRDLERTRREVLKHSDPQRATVPTILGPA